MKSRILLTLALLGIFAIPEAKAGIFVNTPGATIAIGGRIFPAVQTFQDGLGNQFVQFNTFPPQLSFFSGPTVGVINGFARIPRVDFVERRGIFGGRVTRTRIFP